MDESIMKLNDKNKATGQQIINWNLFKTNQDEVGNGNPFQYSCLESSTDRGAWQATVHGVAKSQPQLSTSAYTMI